LLVCVGVLALALLAGPHAQVARDRLFVVTFEVEAPTPRTYWVGEGVAILIAEELTRLGGDAVTRAQRAAAFERQRLPDNAPLTRATTIRVAETVGADALIVGRVSIAERSLSVGARVLRMAEGTYQPELLEQGTPQDLFVVARRLASRLMAPGRPPAGLPGAAAPPGPSLEAFESYVKGLLDPRPDARITLLKAALARQPDYDPPRLALWEAHTAAGEHAAALAVAQSVPVSSPRSREGRFVAALSLIDLQRHDDAFTALTGLAAELPTAPVLNNLGVVQQRREASPQTGLPVYYFTKASEADADDPDIYFNLGYAYWLQNDGPAAIYWLREAVRRDPTDADAHFVLAAALTAAGVTIEAARERELAGRLAARYEGWDRRGSPDEAVPRGLERLQRHFDPLRGPRFDAAITSAAQRDARELTAFYLDRGRRLFEQQHDADAVTELRKALYLSPYEAEAHLVLGRLHLRGGRPMEAIAALRMSLWSREDPVARQTLAEALFAAGQPAEARAEAMRALTLDPSLEPARALISAIDRGQPK
jgi:tetratricopeptide (TPR) repeat protein